LFFGNLTRLFIAQQLREQYLARLRQSQQAPEPSNQVKLRGSHVLPLPLAAGWNQFFVQVRPESFWQTGGSLASGSMQA